MQNLLLSSSARVIPPERMVPVPGHGAADAPQTAEEVHEAGRPDRNCGSRRTLLLKLQERSMSRLYVYVSSLQREAWSSWLWSEGGLWPEHSVQVPPCARLVGLTRPKPGVVADSAGTPRLGRERRTSRLR